MLQPFTTSLSTPSRDISANFSAFMLLQPPLHPQLLGTALIVQAGIVFSAPQILHLHKYKTFPCLSVPTRRITSTPPNVCPEMSAVRSLCEHPQSFCGYLPRRRNPSITNSFPHRLQRQSQSAAPLADDPAGERTVIWLIVCPVNSRRRYDIIASRPSLPPGRASNNPI